MRKVAVEHGAKESDRAGAGWKILARGRVFSPMERADRCDGRGGLLQESLVGAGTHNPQFGFGNALANMAKGFDEVAHSLLFHQPSHKKHGGLSARRVGIGGKKGSQVRSHGNYVAGCLDPGCPNLFGHGAAHDCEGGRALKNPAAQAVKEPASEAEKVATVAGAQDGNRGVASHLRQHRAQSLGDYPVGVDSVEVDPGQEAPDKKDLCHQEKRDLQERPMVFGDLFQDASVVGEGLEPLGEIPIPVDLHAVHDLFPSSPRGMRCHYVNVEDFGQASGKVMDKTRFVVFRPTGKGGRHHQDAKPLCIRCSS